jgi:hypothetical protein
MHSNVTKDHFQEGWGVAVPLLALATTIRKNVEMQKIIYDQAKRFFSTFYSFSLVWLY